MYSGDYRFLRAFQLFEPGAIVKTDAYGRFIPLVNRRVECNCFCLRVADENIMEIREEFVDISQLLLQFGGRGQRVLLGEPGDETGGIKVFLYPAREVVAGLFGADPDQ